MNQTKKPMNLSYVLLSFEGRISRAQWWGAIILLTLTANLMIAFVGGFGHVSTTAKFATLVYVAMFRLGYAVCAKRFQDRNKPGFLALWGMIPWMITGLIPYFGLLDLEHPSLFDTVCFVCHGVVSIWFVIELGCLHGTPGPNRFQLDAISSEGNPSGPAIVVGRLLAYCAAAGAITLMAAVYNSLAWAGTLPASMSVIGLEASPERLSLHPWILPLTTTTVSIAYGTVGFVLGAPCARLALRVLPVDPFGRRSAYTTAVFAFGLLALLGAAFAYIMTSIGFHEACSRAVLNPVGIIEPSRPDWVSWYDVRERLPQESLVRLGWSSILLGGLAMFLYSHARAATTVTKPFALFLRRFSGYADRSLVANIIKSMPKGIPVTFVASRTDRIRNWDATVWAFGGLRLRRPFRNLPLQIRTTDLQWTETVRKLLRRAHCVVLDMSDQSASLAIERKLVLDHVPLDRVVVLVNEKQAGPPSNDPLAAQAIRYSPTYRQGFVPSTIKASLYICIWWMNASALWAWFLLLLVPIAFQASISRDEKRRIQKAISAAMQANSIAPQEPFDRIDDRLPQDDKGRGSLEVNDTSTPSRESDPQDDDVPDPATQTARHTEGPSARVERSQGPCFWLTICATLTGSMLLIESRGFSLPIQLIYFFNPVAWLLNALSLTSPLHGFLLGMDDGLRSLAQLAKLPVVGSFLLLFTLGCFRWRRPGLMFSLLVVPSFGAMQLSTRRAYLALADRFHEQRKYAEEANSLAKALYISNKMQMADQTSEECQTRLANLAPRGSEAMLRPPASQQ